MTIRLETSKRTGIANYQDNDISQMQSNWIKDLGKNHPQARPRTLASPHYNCHGLTFASRRTCIGGNPDIQTILVDDGYEEVTLRDTLPGDVVIYYDDSGDPNHSGVVVENDPGLVVPFICSKWGNAPEFVHHLGDYPRPWYGPNYKFYRCRR